MVAVQVYWPLSDILRGEKVWPIKVVSVTVELGNTMLMSGSTARPGTTVPDQRVGLASNGVPRE